MQKSKRTQTEKTITIESEHAQNEETQKQQCSEADQIPVKINRKHWTSQQNRLYCKFLKQNKYLLQNTFIRKESRVFALLSQYICTRTPKQAKSHHQKMMARHKSLHKIMSYLRRQEQDSNEKSEIISVLSDFQLRKNYTQSSTNSFDLQSGQKYAKITMQQYSFQYENIDEISLDQYLQIKGWKCEF